jgi:hypothetical protein
MKCVICGTVKNCEPYLAKVFQNIEQLGKLFDDYAIVVYCDKSNDKSYNALNEYRKRNPRLIFYYNETPVSRFRTHRLAHARNECIKVIRNCFSDYPYFIMMDFDDVCSQSVKIDVLQKYLHEDTWDALSFNKDPYYDIWALSIHPFAVSFQHLENRDNLVIVMQKYISDILKSSTNLVSCMSAFNGFAIYRTSKFLNCHYDGTLRLDLLSAEYVSLTLDKIKKKFNFCPPGSERSRVEDCEHRSFHLMAINNNGARIRIAPELLF